nr:MAG TPA: hypothetical protein [Caudoviricetes sp.]
MLGRNDYKGFPCYSLFYHYVFQRNGTVMLIQNRHSCGIKNNIVANKLDYIFYSNASEQTFLLDFSIVVTPFSSARYLPKGIHR